MRSLLILCCTLLAPPSAADTVVAARTLRANSILTETDLQVRPMETPGAFTELTPVLGQETRVTLYAGRPVRYGDIGPPAVVERNQIVTLRYSTGGLNILVDGRALGRGGPGDRIRVMNLASRAALFGAIQSDGTITIGREHSK